MNHAGFCTAKLKANGVLWDFDVFGFEITAIWIQRLTVFCGHFQNTRMPLLRDATPELFLCTVHGVLVWIPFLHWQGITNWTKLDCSCFERHLHEAVHWMLAKPGSQYSWRQTTSPDKIVDQLLKMDRFEPEESKKLYTLRHGELSAKLCCSVFCNNTLEQ